MYIKVVSKRRHADASSSSFPVDPEQRLFFCLLEMIDFECFKYGDAPESLDEESVKTFLIKHKDNIRCEPPTYLGAICGVYDFLNKTKEEIEKK
jgi:hypothetical protein